MHGLVKDKDQCNAMYDEMIYLVKSWGVTIVKFNNREVDEMLIEVIFLN